MKSFSVDLYIWYEDAGTWLLIPPYPSEVDWSISLSQSEILLCEAGVTFRVDDVLWLGNERDSFPLEELVSDLYCTICENSAISKNEVRLNISASQYLEFKRDQSNQILLSRLGVVCEDDYSDRISKFVGTYYQNFPVDANLWDSAVQRSLDGLAFVFNKCIPDIDPKIHSLALWLISRWQGLEKSS